MMLLDRLRTAAASLRQPEPVRTRSAPPKPEGQRQMALASGMTPVEGVTRLLDLTGASVAGRVLVLPSVASQPGKGAHPHLVAALLLQLGDQATLGLPATTPMPVRRRWQQLARERDVDTVTLGDAGWDAVTLDEPGYLLDVVHLPAELYQVDQVLAVPALGDEALAIGFMRDIAHPNTRLRARGTTDRARLDAEVASAVTATWLLDASRLPGLIATNLAVLASDAVTAELAGRTIHGFIDSARGFETIGAWEHPRVQAATELGIGPATGDDILLRVPADDARLVELTDFFRSELGVTVERVEGGS